MVKVGLGVFITNDAEVLLMKRKAAHGNDTWAPPGGKLELGETFFECARREALEELGILIQEIKIIGITNDIFSPDNHYITVHTLATHYSDQPRIMEPDKCSEIRWFAFNNLPSPLFLSVANLIKNNPLILERENQN